MVIHGIHDYKALWMVNASWFVKVTFSTTDASSSGDGSKPLVPLWNPKLPGTVDFDPHMILIENSISGMDIQLYTVISGGDPIFI